MDDLLFEQIQEPYSMEAEQALLGAVLMNPACYTRVSGIVRPDIPQHKAIFAAIANLDYLNQKIDPLLVLEELKQNGTYDEAAGKNYLAQLAQSVPSVENVESYARIIKEKYYLRTLMEAAEEMLKNAANEELSADTIMDAAEQKIYNIRQKTSRCGFLIFCATKCMIICKKSLRPKPPKKAKAFPPGFRFWIST